MVILEADVSIIIYFVFFILSLLFTKLYLVWHIGHRLLIVTVVTHLGTKQAYR